MSDFARDIYVGRERRITLNPRHPLGHLNDLGGDDFFPEWGQPGHYGKQCIISHALHFIRDYMKLFGILKLCMCLLIFITATDLP